MRNPLPPRRPAPSRQGEGAGEMAEPDAGTAPDDHAAAAPAAKPGGNAGDGEGAGLGPLARCSRAIDGGLRDFFGALAGKIAEWPKATIALSLVVCAVFASGFSQYDEETEASKLWTPQDTEAMDDKAWVERTFGFDDRQVTMYAEARGQNIATAPRAASFQRAWARASAVTAAHGGETVTWPSLCVADGAACRAPRSPLGVAAWNYNEAAILADPAPLATLDAGTLPTGGPTLATYLGNSVTDAQGRYQSVAAFKLVALLQNNITSTDEGEKDPRADNWENNVGEVMQGWSGGEDVRVYVDAQGYMREQSKSAIQDDLKVLFAGYALMIIYLCAVFWRRTKRRSHIAVALLSIFSVALSTLASYGLALYIGEKYNPLVTILVLVLLGIGVDDTFVIFDAWVGCEKKDDGEVDTDPKNRLVRALRIAGPSITVTSITDIIVFAAGVGTIIPALKGFCVYACFGIFFDFLFQVTFVVAVIYLDGVREQDGRMDCCCCCKVEEATGCCGETVPEGGCGNKPVLKNAMRDVVPRFLLSVPGTVVVFLIWAGFLAAGIVGSTKLQMDFNMEWFVPDDSPLQDTFSVRDRYFGNRGNLPFAVYSGDVDYSSEAVQRQILELQADLQADKWVADGSVHSWYSAFRTSLSVADAAVIPPASFHTQLQTFLASASGQRYADGVRWDAATTRVVAARVDAQLIGQALSNGESSVDAMQSVRGSAKRGGRGAAPFSARAYSRVFVQFEGYAVIKWETLRNLIVAGCCCFAVCLVLLASLPGALLTLFSIVCTDLDLMGFSYWTGYTFNQVTMIQMVVAIGLSVDYTVHIVHTYLTHSGSARARSAHALGELGAAVLNGGTSTFLAIAPLAAAKSYVFEVFFVMFAWTILFGLFHGVVVVPCVVRYAGPASYPDATPCPPAAEKEAAGGGDMTGT